VFTPIASPAEPVLKDRICQRGLLQGVQEVSAVRKLNSIFQDVKSHFGRETELILTPWAPWEHDKVDADSFDGTRVG
jgi:hypothetical protein